MLARIGHWVQKHAKWIARIQWIVVFFYLFLILVPVFLPLPDHTARMWNHLTVFSQFMFWGIWWPFVLVSMVLFGRMWCGVFCPEGTLTEVASKYGRHRHIPHWIRWKGWPFVAFLGTTVYGQMASVYQYPKAALMVLGGSTLAAIVVGFLYGKEKRVWCRYLCPVNGVFGLLSKLAPIHFKVNEMAWKASYGQKIIPINCAPLLPLRNMQGSASCHMCGRCSGHRDAISLTRRSTSEEIVRVGKKEANFWDSALILYGLMGLAIGAFHWTTSSLFIEAKQWIATWLIEHDILWPLDQDSPPWWLLTHYPEVNDSFSWLDGGLVISYILIASLVLGTCFLVWMLLANYTLGRWQTQRFHHLTQALIPLAGVGVFLGLSATTITLLKAEDIPTLWATDVRMFLLVGASVWSLWLAMKVSLVYTQKISQLIQVGLCLLGVIMINGYSWVLFFGW